MNSANDQPATLAAFVKAALQDEKQSAFCRRTGFDQGMMSKILTGMATTLTLETALRLAVGLGVQPEQIFGLIAREDLHTLIAEAYLQPLRDRIAELERLTDCQYCSRPAIFHSCGRHPVEF